MEKIKSRTNYKFIYYIPLIFLIVVLPFITHGKIIELSMEEANFWKGGTTHVDFFCYYKSIGLVLGTCAFLLSFCFLYLSKKVHFNKSTKYYMPMIIYVIFVVISTLLSHYKNTAVIGFMEMYQGMSVLLCYIVITIIIINLVSEENDIKIILTSFAFLSIVMGILGLSQYFGHDFFQSDLGKLIITPKELRGVDLKFTFGKYAIYGTLYNTNFVGSFGALLLPVTTFLFIYSKEIKYNILFYMAAILSYTTWLGSNSRAGYLGIFIACLAAVLFIRKIIKHNIVKILVLFIGFVIATLIFNIASEGKTFTQLGRLNPFKEAQKIEQVLENNIRFKEISVSKNTFTFKTTKETVKGIVDNNNLSFQDQYGNLLTFSKDEKGTIKFDNKNYENYEFVKAENSRLIKCTVYDKKINLYSLKDDTVKVVSFNNKLTEPVEAPRLKLFDGRETFASNRGYIWSRTIPLIKDTLFIGAGPDNFIYIFPQEDYLGKFNTSSGMTNMLVDKPHNMYLQTAINTGVISLISLLIMWFIYLAECIKIYGNRKLTTFTEYMGAAVFLSVIAYLGAGLFNDNIISVTPLFWIMLGTGIGINKLNN